MEINVSELILYLIQAIIILLLILLIKMFKNGSTESVTNGAPGKAAICIERGEKIQEHDTTLEHLVKDLDEEKKNRNKFRDDIRDNFKTIFSELRKITK